MSFLDDLGNVASGIADGVSDVASGLGSVVEGASDLVGAAAPFLGDVAGFALGGPASSPARRRPTASRRRLPGFRRTF